MPQAATDLLLAWFLKHLDNPTPSKADVAELVVVGVLWSPPECG